jgi:ABC-type sugar transport system ATPase subunit
MKSTGMKILTVLCAAALSVGASASAPARKTLEVMVGSAASPPVEEIVKIFEKKEGVKVEARRPREENVEGSWHIGIRPENLVLIRPDRPLAPWMTSNLLEGVVERVLNLGNRRVLSVSVTEGDGLSLEVALSQHAYHDVRPAEGDAVRLHVKPENIWLHRE